MGWKVIKWFDKPRWTLQTIITLLVCIVVIMALLVTDILITGKISKGTQQNQAERATDIARIVAQSPLVIEGLSNKNDEGKIQTFANQIMDSSHVEFVVVMDMNGIRKSHPNKNRIGEHFVGGDEGAVLKGKEHISIAKGTLGMSLRSFVPVIDVQNKQIGAVAVGISLEKVNNSVAQSRKIIYIGIGFGILVGVIGALILARKIKTILFGLEPSQIAKLLEERSAMLQSTKEGMIAVDQQGFITLVNNEGKRILKEAGIKTNPIGELVEDYMPNTRLHTILKSGISEFDQEQDLNGITILTNRIPVIVKGRIVGAIATFRDKTDIKQLAEQLTGVKLYVEALRAQSHEFMNKLHVILGLIHIGNYEVLSTYITKMVDFKQTEMEFVVERFKEPVLAGFILGKLSFARESGAELVINGEGTLPEPEQQDIIHEVVTILGNLIDNAVDAVKESENKIISLRFDYFENILVIEIQDSGKGLDDELKMQIFQKGFSTKGQNRGFGLFLVQQSLEKLKGELEIYSKENKGTTFIVTLPYKSKLV
ncbi:DcuS/MalK family sensor histidine kinase [Neobacillus sp. PS3-40]|uniref:DcuS/MalK family sensor histidine kinase n=1 Tax=Neobacillus sp. PS3-40 TaxID=3070679 RepID=UPI0027E078F2|nr:DcuS/MalK family sensor histidine kinase [Neobacillus sp. PS3-40]WML45710.1 DcuS/MalK family sensor histidine kinase [Neobacillus sp. PS3-40]